MNERIEGLWWQARIGYNNQNCDPEVLAKFAQFIVADCVNYINTEIDRLHDYQNSLPEYSSHSQRADVDLAIEKCMDNIQGIKKHFGE